MATMRAMPRGSRQCQTSAALPARCSPSIVFSARTKQSARRSLWALKSSELDVIDPVTGEVISKAASINPVAGFRVSAGGLEWAYRRSQVEGDAAGGGKVQVLLLHGLGSSSYSYRNTLGYLGADGYDAIAPDWIGHGDSAKPAPGGQFDYSQTAYLDALDQFVAAVGLDKKPFALVVQGYILGQYGLLYALRRPDWVQRLLVLNTPVGLTSKLRPELAPYKAPLAFMRPGNKPFDGANYAASGSAYVMDGKDADVYARPYRESPAASAAVAATMDKMDWGKLLKEVDDGYRSWRKPSLLLYGSNDPFVKVPEAFDFLESKRTNMKCVTPSAKLGHMPQEDYAEAIADAMAVFLSGTADDWAPAEMLKMTKRGAVRA